MDQSCITQNVLKDGRLSKRRPNSWLGTSPTWWSKSKVEILLLPFDAGSGGWCHRWSPTSTRFLGFFDPSYVTAWMRRTQTKKWRKMSLRSSSEARVYPLIRSAPGFAQGCSSRAEARWAPREICNRRWSGPTKRMEKKRPSRPEPEREGARACQKLVL